MDPDANLQEQLALARGLQRHEDKGTAWTPAATIDAMRLTELVLTLDEWLANGGFPPTPWWNGTP